MTKHFIIYSVFLLLLACNSKKMFAQEVRTVVQTGHLAKVLNVDVSADGKYLVSSDANSKVVLWNTATGRQIREFNLQGKFNASESPLKVYFNRLSTAVVVSDYFKTFAFDLMTGKRIAYWYNWVNGIRDANSQINELMVKRCPTNLTPQVKGSDIHLYDSSHSLVQTFSSSIDSIGRLATHLYGQDGSKIEGKANPRYWWLDAKKPFLLDLKLGKVIKRLDSPNTRWSDIWRDMKGNLVIWDNKDAICRYRFDDGSFIDRINLAGKGEVNHLAFLSDMQYIVYNRNKDLWATNFVTHKSLPVELTEKADKSQIMGIASLPTPNDFIVLRRSTYCPIQMRLNMKKEMLLGNARNKIAGMQYLGANQKGTLRLIRGERFVSLFLNDNIFTQYRATNNTCASPFSEKIAAGYATGKIELFDMLSTQVTKTFYPHTARINDMLMHPFYEMVLSASDDGTVAIYNSDEEKVVAYFTSMNNGKDYILRTPDNYYMASRYGTDAVSFVVGSDTYMFDQFDLKYNRPDIVLERIGLASKEQIELMHRAYLKRLKRMGMTEEMLSNDFHVPTLSIDNKAELSKSKELNQTLSVTPSDSRYKLSSVNVWINGVKVLTLDNPTNGKQLKLPIDLAHGTNYVQVSCTNEKGVESYKQALEVKTQEAQHKSDLWIVSLGASQYADNRFNLHYASKDAIDIGAAFKRIGTSDYAQVHSLVLTNEKVKKSLLTEVRKFLSQAKRDDSVILFYAGHGLVDQDYDYYLASYDTDFLNPSEKALPYEDFEQLLDGIAPLKKLLLLDACYSGEIDKEDMTLATNTNTVQITKPEGIVFRATGSNAPKLNQVSAEQINSLISENFSNLQRGTGATVISSASGVEVSMEGAQWRNGLFTYCLLRGLSDKQADTDGDGKLSVAELQTYCQDQVSRMSAGKQRPTSRNENRMQPFWLHNYQPNK